MDKMYKFPSPYEFNERDPVTLVELRMRRLSGLIRAKPRWWIKVQDEVLVAKWREEFVELDRVAIEEEWHSTNYRRFGNKKWPKWPITSAQLDYVFDELKFLAGHRDEQTNIQPTVIYAVYECQSLIPEELKMSLRHAMSSLECIPDDKKDWHPGSNRQVLDLVHPSLYCLRIGRSVVRNPTTGTLRRCTWRKYRAYRQDFIEYLRLGEYHSEDEYKRIWQSYNSEDEDEDENMAEEQQRQAEALYGTWREERLTNLTSRNFQWLPTDFTVSEMGEAACRGYINNLHPIEHRPLYSTITSVFQRFLPMFEKVLSDAVSPFPPRVIHVNPMRWYSHLPPTPEGSEGSEKGDEEEQSDEEEEEEEDTGPGRGHDPLIPDPPIFEPPRTENRTVISLNGRTLQVIVKLANIVLTPANPKYPGGSWHVEGMVNERIVATGIYYYACENITESRLAFRGTFGTDSSEAMYQYGDQNGWEYAFGYTKGDFLHQELGHIVAAEDVCVAFPNLWQHRVEPFELADASKPGHRKILCFFLVDPFHRIYSTTDVPPQQREWYLEEMRRIPELKKLPQEVFDIVADYALQDTITRQQAEEDRMEVMKERSDYVVAQNRDVYEIRFNMCEH